MVVPTDSQRTTTVLIVEDNDAVRQIMRRTLEAEGYCVNEATDGLEALSILTGDTPVNVVVADLCMPGMDGWELARKLAARSPQILSLFVSGYRPHIRNIGLRGPVLAKPFTPDQLVASVRQLLLSPEARNS